MPDPLRTPSAWTAGEERRTIDAAGWRLEAIGASLDHLSYRGRDILRALRVVVRDHDWRTVPAVLDSLSVEAAVVTLRAHHDDLGVRASWTATLRLEPGRLALDVDLVAESAFRRNRIGIVALHSPGLAGRSLDVVHSSGTVTETVFPVEVSPHQPAVDIAALRWQVAADASVSLSFDGDVFEMEDQRNWTDASYKTYSTPLDASFPVEVRPGDRVRQSAVIEVSDTGTSFDGPADETFTGVVAQATTMPRILVGASTAPGRPSQRPAWLAGVDVQVELVLGDPSWSRALARARADAGSGSLDVRLVASDAGQLAPAVAALCGVPVARLGVFDAATHVTTPELWEALRTLALREPVTGTLVGGTRAHFTELNRTHDALPHDLGGVAFSITPQMHDVSTDQVVESLAEQRRVASQAVRIAAGRPVHVGPVTLRARFNAVATSSAPPASADIDQHGSGAELVWNATDPRQQTDEYATWLLASAIALAVPGVESLCFAEAWGPRGFGSADGQAYPAAEVLGWLAPLTGADVLPLSADAVPAGVFALAVRLDAGTVILAANVAAAAVRFSLLGQPLSLPPMSRTRLFVPSSPPARSL